jgi:hypothetical protein
MEQTNFIPPFLDPHLVKTSVAKGENSGVEIVE